MTRMKRTFHPVGQGAFYSEEFYEPWNSPKRFNIVYDCGSNNTKELHREIKSYGPKKIDILFISHFHEDHINGIKELMIGRTIERVIMPYLRSIDKLLFVGASSEGSENLNLYLNPSSFFNEKSKLVYVLPLSENYEANREDIPIDINEIQEGNINSGTSLALPVKDKQKKWYFIPSNLQVDDNKIKDFIAELTGIGLNVENLDVAEIVKKQSEIREVYKTVFQGSLNNTSMVLYSGGFLDNYDCDYLRCHYCRLHCICRDGNCKVGCLYTGDLHLIKKTSNWLDAVYNKYKTTIKTIQTPHHGSSTSKLKGFWSKFYSCNAVITYGSNNNYKHPSPSTISSIVSSGKLPIFVNEAKCSEFGYHIYIH